MADNLVTVAELVSTRGDERLRLLYTQDGRGLDFHALLFEDRTETGWVARTTITQADFQGGHPNRRWISNLHSFMPSTETAIIQVAEGDRPWKEFRATMYGYSWRRWDLNRNHEIARLKECNSPFDPL